jgi:hypothetical protein
MHENVIWRLRESNKNVEAWEQFLQNSAKKEIEDLDAHEQYTNALNDREEKIKELKKAIAYAFNKE